MANDKDIRIKVSLTAGEAAKELDALGKKAEEAATNTDGLTTANKTLKQQLKEAVKEAQLLAAQFGETSKEAFAAQKKVAVLKEEISDFGDRINALNPEAKFTAISKVASGIAGGFSAATGAMALFGGESEDVQKALLKVQAALAFSQGLNEIKGLSDSFKNLGVVATKELAAIQKATGLALGPLALIAGAIAIVGVEIYSWITAESELEKQIKASEEAEKQRLDQSIKSYDRQIKLAKALGESTRQLELDKQEAIISTEKLKLKQLQRDKDKEFETAKSRLQAANFGVDAFADKKRKLSQEEIDSANAIADAENQLQVLRIENHKVFTDVLAEGVKVEKKSAETIHKTKVEEKKKEREEVELIEKKELTFAQEELPLAYQTGTAFILDHQRTALDNFKTLVGEAANEINAFLQSKTGQSIDFANQTVNTNLQTVSNFFDAAASMQLDAAKGNEARQEEIRKKFFERDKKVQIAQALISTYQGATSAFASGSKLSPIAGFISAAAAIALGLSNVAKIRAQTYQGGGSSGGGSSGVSVPSFNSNDTTNTPNFGTSQVNRDKVEQGQPFVIKNVIAETDITRVQKRINMIEERAKIH